MKKAKVFLCIVLALVMLGALFACNKSDTSSGSQGGTQQSGGSGDSGGGSGGGGGDSQNLLPLPSKTVTVSVNSQSNGVDPHNNIGGIGGLMITSQCHEGLVFDDRNGGYEPLLATSWESNAAGTVWRFQLRQDVKFHNGEPFSADDVKTTFDRLFNDPTLYAYTNSCVNIIRCDKIDEYTVEFEFDGPNYRALSLIGTVMIIPGETFTQYGEELWAKQEVYGTGPWMFQEWVDGDYARFIKNPDYWGKDFYDPYYEEIYLRFITEASVSTAAQLAGDINVNLKQAGIDREMLGMYEGTQNRFQRIEMDTGFTYIIGFQCEEGKVFHDKNARMAFDYCVDRQAIVDYVLSGGGKVPNSVFPDNVLGYDPSLPAYEYNPDLAREYLAKSDYDGRKIELSTTATSKKAEECLLAIRDYMVAIGFDVDILVVQSAEFASKRTSGDYDLYYTAVNYSGYDPSSYLTIRVLTDTHKSNFSHIDGYEEMMDSIRKALVELDEGRREQYFKRVGEIMRAEAAPHTGMNQLNQICFIDLGVIGIDFWVDGSFTYKYIDFDPTMQPNW